MSYLLGTACLGLLTTAHAQNAMPRQPVAAVALVEQVCAACHGLDGNSRRADVPSLAGLTAPYLNRQLRAFAAQGDQRANGIMGAIAVNLSVDEMRAVSVYYAREARRAASPTDRQEAKTYGEKIFATGLPSIGVASCASCHGARGQGLSPMFPRLAGQSESYLREQLRHFRSARRASDPGAMMRMVAARLSDRDIDAVASYAARLP